MLTAGLNYDAGRAAYLAAFHAAQAIIFERSGKVVKTHRGVNIEFLRLTKDDPVFTPDQRRFLSQAYDFKAVADYDTGPMYSGHNGCLPEPFASVTVRAALERDYPAIARIQQNCPEAAQWPVGDYSGYSVLMVCVNSTPAGFCAWRQSAPEEAELLNLGVDPAWRGRGVASKLIDELRRAARGEIFLEVAATNAPALTLYRKRGWEQIGIRRGYYAGGIDAVVMKIRSW
jgi:ribosomal protein S18 acetylase RimI-like enzyme